MNIFIATHSNRLRCLFYNLLNEKIKGFYNCSVILLQFKNNKLIKIELIYDNGYSKKMGVNPKSKYFTKLQFDNFIKDKNIDMKIDSDSDINIFLIRHGQGYHNVSKNVKQLLSDDPKLTRLGILDAFNCGKEIFTRYPNITSENSMFFCSLLYRTMQTISLFMLGIEHEIIKNTDLDLMKKSTFDPKIYILPNNHEIVGNSVPSYCNKTYQDVYKNIKVAGPSNTSLFYKNVIKNTNKDTNYNTKFIYPMISFIRSLFKKRDKYSLKSTDDIDLSKNYYHIPYQLFYSEIDLEENKKDFLSYAVQYLEKPPKDRVKSVEIDKILDSSIEYKRRLAEYLNKETDNLQKGGELKIVIENIMNGDDINRYTGKLKKYPDLHDHFLQLVKNNIEAEYINETVL